MSDRSDNELLKAFSADRDTGAFTELMERHGGTVAKAAFSVIGETSATEDVVQAAFLTLIRKASSLADVRSLAGWLYRTGIYLAREEIRRRDRRSAREKQAFDIAAQHKETCGVPEASLAAMYEELSFLPEIYRIPVILHYLEGHSYDDAACVLGCTGSAFSMRLTRAREKLKKRLIKRGITGVTMASLTAMLAQTGEAAEVSAGFVAATCEAASGGAVSAKVGALTESALKMLFWGKVKAVGSVCASVVAIGAAAVGMAVMVPLVLNRGAAPVQVEDAALWAWTSFAQNSREPTRVRLSDGTPFTDVRAAASGMGHSVVLDSAGGVWAWGGNNMGQLGDGTTTSRANPARVLASDGSAFSGVTAVAAGELHSVALMSDRTVWAWGSGFECGSASARILYPAKVDGISEVRAVSARVNHTVALKADSTVWEWGFAVGVPRRRVPALVQQSGGGALSNVVAISAGTAHAVALKKDGGVWTWGSGLHGPLGHGGKPSVAISRVAVQVRASDGSPLSGVVAIAAGHHRTAAVKSDNSIWVWGCLGVGRGLSKWPSAVQLVPASGVTLGRITTIAAGTHPYDIFVLVRDGVCLGLKVEAIDTAEEGMADLRFTAERIGDVTGAVSISTTSDFGLIVTGRAE